jgi:cytochrome b561
MTAKTPLNPTNSARYSGTAKALHWTIAVLLVIQFAVAWLMPHIGRDTVPDTLINLHFSLGVLILAVATFRLAYRFGHGEPTPLESVSARQLQFARTLHWLLYILLLVLPVLGWVNASWRGFAVILFGFELPKLLTTRAAGWSWTGDAHVLLSNYGLLGLVGLHVLVALYHRFVRRDGVMERMLPGK